jgi:hypothetical protein
VAADVPEEADKENFLSYIIKKDPANLMLLPGFF